MKATKFILLFTVILLLASCSFQKRHYMPGYSIDLKGKNLSDKKNTTSPAEIIMDNSAEMRTTSITQDTCDVTEPINGKLNRAKIIETAFQDIKYKNHEGNNKINSKTKKIKSGQPLEKNITNPDSCDTIFLKNGEIIYGKVMEMNGQAAKIFNCNHKNQYPREINAISITKIAFNNGKIVHYDSIYLTNKKIITYIPGNHDILFLYNGKIADGTVTAMRKNKIKFIYNNDSAKKAVEISSKFYDKIYFENGEEISRDEINEIRNEITSRDSILRYTQGTDFKERKIEKLIKNATILGSFSFLPVIGIGLGLSGKHNLHLAKEYIKRNPELNKYMVKVNKAETLCSLGVTLGIISLIILFFASLKDEGVSFQVGI